MNFLVTKSFDHQKVKNCDFHETGEYFVCCSDDKLDLYSVIQGK